ncbi:MAG TPA: hypothetical protein VN715_15530 [Roseiarcus sp.]|nr:hypothetical protein [Roseiarcus sp.]
MIVEDFVERSEASRFRGFADMRMVQYDEIKPGREIFDGVGLETL